MSYSIICNADLTVERPLEATLPLFTPEGERTWAAGWNPTYPHPERTEGVGVVFVTAQDDDHTTTWVMVDNNERGIRYTRVSPGMTAGTIAVSVIHTEAHSTRLRVTYDLTALSSHGAEWLTAFADNYAEYIAHWEAAIADPQHPTD